MTTTDLHNGCTTSHTGTSASAPMAAGLLALVLEANPNLTWRDVQHITVRNAQVANLKATDWRVNALGRNYSHSFGYGVMDASAMVKMAQTWTLVPQKYSANVQAQISSTNIPPRTSRTAKMEVTEHGQVKPLSCGVHAFKSQFAGELLGACSGPHNLDLSPKRRYPTVLDISRRHQIHSSGKATT